MLNNLACHANFNKILCLSDTIGRKILRDFIDWRINKKFIFPCRICNTNFFLINSDDVIFVGQQSFTNVITKNQILSQVV